MFVGPIDGEINGDVGSEWIVLVVSGCELSISLSVVFDTVFGSDHCVAVYAPTGSGKTLIFELAIIKAISDHGKVHKN